jgi:predicted CXXCH cytochrome family protein
LPAGGTIGQDMLDSGKLQCTACHDQHDNSQGNFLVKTGFSLCFTCHLFTPAEGSHHIPNRENPWGQTFGCAACHGENLGGSSDGGMARACTNCHNDFEAPNGPPPGHHGENRYDPLADCSGCHGPTLDGAPYGSVVTPSCNSCHDDVWDGGNQPPVVDAGGPYAGYAGTEVQFDGSGTFDSDPTDTLTYEWVFGDGSPAQFPSPSPTAAHVFQTPGIYSGWLSVTDGVRAPVLEPFVVEIIARPPAADSDSWTVTTTASPAELFTISIEDHAGVLVVVKDNGVGGPSLAFGVEFAGVIFWMDIWMDISGNVFWGVGDTFFGNIDRNAGTMSGVVFDEQGGTATFSGRVNR